MSKEIAQTVCGKRIAWLVAIVAAFVVFATLGSQFQYAFAASATISSVSASSQTASASIVDYGIGIEATTASYAVASQTTDALRSVTSFRSYTVTVNEPLTVAALTSSQNSRATFLISAVSSKVISEHHRLQ